MTDIKICGLTRREDVDAAIEAGAGMIGLIFTPESPRVISTDQAQRLVTAVPDDVKVVGVFMNQAAADVSRVLAEINLDILQFHGDEDNEWCRQFELPFFKAVSMRMPADLQHMTECFPDAFALLLDSHGKGEAGGQGQVFDWSAIDRRSDVRIVLAGGLGPANVREAIVKVQPWAVDVSSGVEMAHGIKDHELMHDFCQQVKRPANDTT